MPTGLYISLNCLQFDDSEFQSDLPEIEAPQSLESILNEDETASVLEEEEIPIPSALQAFKDSQSMDTSSMSSQDSSLTDKPAKKERYSDLALSMKIGKRYYYQK